MDSLKSFKKLFSVVITAVLVFTTLFTCSILVNAQEVYNEGYYSYTITKGQACITECDKSISGDITIPATLGGYPVVEIGENAFYECLNIESVVVSEKVKSIGVEAFAFCENLTDIYLPKSVENLGEFAFSYCINLSNIEVADDNIYYSSLDGVLYSKNKDVIILYPLAKEDTTFNLPDSVAMVSYYAFMHCLYLENIEVGGDNAYYSSIDGVLFNKDKTQLILYPIGRKNESYTVPSGVTEVSAYSFLNAYNLLNVVIGEDVECIAEGAFAYCSVLESVTISDSVKSIKIGAFCENKRLKKINFGKGVENIGEQAFFGCTSLTKLAIPNSVKNIDLYAFSSCSNLKNVSIPSSIEFIGEYAFEYCEGLENVYFYGTEAQWNNIDFSINDELLNAARYFILGDINGDDYINASDIVELKKAIFLSSDNELVVEGSAKLFDVNDDYNVDVLDMVYLKEKLLSAN